jgi:hypothetical protein
VEADNQGTVASMRDFTRVQSPSHVVLTPKHGAAASSTFVIATTPTEYQVSGDTSFSPNPSAQSRDTSPDGSCGNGVVDIYRYALDGLLVLSPQIERDTSGNQVLEDRSPVYRHPTQVHPVVVEVDERDPKNPYYCEKDLPNRTVRAAPKASAPVEAPKECSDAVRTELQTTIGRAIATRTQEIRELFSGRTVVFEGILDVDVHGVPTFSNGTTWSNGNKRPAPESVIAIIRNALPGTLDTEGKCTTRIRVEITPSSS